ncbi:hypothetical protein HUN39_01700 [Methylocystis sp. FS]|uniref:hypothetical protein n=1 Tax=Methylocystis silviterrae TaxID=2743612 RepID=UPI001581C3D7|nr:hypothetical protein [Methylocystis silviterrae]NUJ78764.1 hypothetical protein [Methylocystis silviterrae]
MTLANISRSNRLLLAGFFGAIALTAIAVAPAHADNVSQCARYGADYVAVAGSNGCVRLGGHVRVSMPRTPVAPLGYTDMRRDGMQHAAARSSLPPMAPFGLHDLFPR